MNTARRSSPLPASMEDRATWFREAGGLDAAVDAGRLSEPVSLPLAEGLVLGLMRQGVTKYLAIFGHGSTALGEVLRVYEGQGLVRCWQFRNEVAMAHAGTALRWVYGEPCALVTSIGPGALQAMAGSLAAASNGIGVYHLYGDETTHGEGYNMQQVPKPAQGLFGQMTALMGESWTLHSPGALRAALRRGAMTVFHPWRAGPFYLNLPINTQPADALVRLDALPRAPEFPPSLPAGYAGFAEAARRIAEARRVAVKAGGGSRPFARPLREFAEQAGSGGGAESLAPPACFRTATRRTCTSVDPRDRSAATSSWRRRSCWWWSAVARCARATARGRDGRRSATSSTSTPTRKTSSTTTGPQRSAAMQGRCWSA